MWPKRAMLVETKSFSKSVIYRFCVCNLCFQITVFKKEEEKSSSSFFCKILKSIACNCICFSSR